MPQSEEDKNKQPEKETPEKQVATEQSETDTQTQPDILPEKIETEADKLAALEQQHEQEKRDLAEKIRLAEQEKETLKQRLKDNQEYISRTRNVEKPVQQEFQPPRKTIDEYIEDLGKKFEDDPKEAIKKFVRDVAFDRDLERQEYDKRITEAENRAFKRVLSLDPDKAKIFQDVEKLDQDRADLANLTFEQKVEWIRRGTLDPKQKEMENQLNRDRDLASDVGGTRNAQKAERLPDWVNDREVQEKAKDHFASKKELADWADPKKAREMAKKNRPKYID